MSTSQIKVIDKLSNEILFECALDDASKAYAFARQMTEMGLDIDVLSPTITESLTDCLGMSLDEKDEYEQSVIAEIQDHDSGCCASLENSNKDKLQ